MLKRIALMGVFVATAAFAGIGVAKAQSGVKTPGSIVPQGIKCGGGLCATVVAPIVPRGIKCAGGGCATIVAPIVPQGIKCAGGGC